MDEVTQVVARAVDKAMHPFSESGQLEQIRETQRTTVVAKAAIAAHKQAIKGAGMVIVPRVPSEAMLKAATNEGLRGKGVHSGAGGWHGHMGRVYTAMIEAHEAG